MYVAILKDVLTQILIPLQQYKVGLLLGTTPQTRVGRRTNQFFKNRIDAAESLYKAEKIKSILIGGDENSLDAGFTLIGAATKEVLFYREAINEGFKLVRNKNILTLNDIKRIQEVLEQNSAGFRTTPGTQLKRSSDGVVIYTPPQDGQRIVELMSNLEQFINGDELCPIDPLVKMAIIHHQFESIHPFYDGNGRTGRIVNILYLVTSGLLDLPILYLSRYITHNKAEYYERIQAIRNATGDNSAQWEAWILYMLRGVEQAAEETIALVKNIGKLMTEYKNILYVQSLEESIAMSFSTVSFIIHILRLAIWRAICRYQDKPQRNISINLLRLACCKRSAWAKRIITSTLS